MDLENVLPKPFQTLRERFQRICQDFCHNFQTGNFFDWNPSCSGICPTGSALTPGECDILRNVAIFVDQWLVYETRIISFPGHACRAYSRCLWIAFATIHKRSVISGGGGSRCVFSILDRILCSAVPGRFLVMREGSIRRFFLLCFF